MTEPRRCPQCDAEIPINSPAGLCPRCLLKASTDSQSAGTGEPGPTKLTPPASGFVPPTVEELAPLFPQLEILELLGKGGMGAVYKARQPGLDRLVALKILPPEISRDPTFTERFQREARALARLSHPHIVAVYDFGQVRSDPIHRVEPATDRINAVTTSGLCYIVMEFVDGANLRQAIQTKTLTPAEALAIVPQICEALQFAHDEGIVHRDIKPENILIDKRGRVKIADFGLAKLLGTDAGDHSLTATHQVMGTLRYMAPEQMQGSREVDHRADIYSLGVVFYELLTGELPMGRFSPPSKRVHIDVRLDEVVLRALEQDPELRYQHASELKTDVEYVSSQPQPRSSSPQTQPTEQSNEIKSSSWSTIEITTAVVVGIAFVLAAVKGIFELAQRPSPLDNVAMFVTAVATVAVVVLLVLQQLGQTHSSRAAMPGFCIAVLATCAGSLPWTAVFSPIAGWLFWHGAVFASLNFFLSLGLLIAGDAQPRTRAISLLLVGLIDCGLVIAFDIGPVGVIGSNFLGTITSKPGLPGEFIAEALGLLAMIAGALQLRNCISSKADVTSTPPLPSSEPRLSRCALVGAIWVPLLFLAGVVTWVAQNSRSYGPGEYTGPAWWLLALMFTVLPLGVLAPIGTTILGAIGIAKIKRSEGKLYGLRLAQADALLFPLLLLGAAAFLAGFLLVRGPMRGLPPSAGLDEWFYQSPRQELVALLIALPIWFFPARALFRAVVGPRDAFELRKLPLVGDEPLIGKAALMVALAAIAAHAWPWHWIISPPQLSQRPMTISNFDVIDALQSFWLLVGSIGLALFASASALARPAKIILRIGSVIAVILALVIQVRFFNSLGEYEPGVEKVVRLTRTYSHMGVYVTMALTGLAILFYLLRIFDEQVDPVAGDEGSISPERRVKAPAIWLLLTGLFAVVQGVALLVLVVGFLGGHQFSPRELILLSILGAALVAAGIVIGIGAWRMLQMRGYRWAVAAAILGQPLGIWSFVVLTRRDVKAAFDEQASASDAVRGFAGQKNPTHGLGQISLWTAILGVVLPALLLLGGIVLSSRVSIPEGFVIVCFLLGVGLELVAIGCGIAARRTPSGKAGLIIGSISLVLWLATLAMVPVSDVETARHPDAITESSSAPLPLGTITSGIGAEFTVPAGHVATFEIVTRRDNETVPVPPHCGYVMAPPDTPIAGTFRWSRKPKEDGTISRSPKWSLEIRTGGGGGGYSEAILLPDVLNAAVGARGLSLGVLEPNEEAIHWGSTDANNLPANGLIGLRVTVVAHGQKTGGSGNAHIDWKSQATQSTSRRKLPIDAP